MRNNREEGVKEGLERTERKMLAAGLDPAQIANFVALSVEQISALVDE